MKYVKALTLTFTLILVLATAAFAGETSCPPPPAPGETQGPPCAVQSVNDAPVVPGETLTPSAQPFVNVTDIAETMLWSLLLF